jgi:WW domain-binding protein 4
MSSQQRRTAPWQNNERHYCAVCNAWMGSDRQSVMLHENGKKHLLNAEKAQQNKRKEKQQQEQSVKFLNDSLKQMEKAAAQAPGISVGQQHPPPTFTGNRYQMYNQQQPGPAAVPSSWSAAAPPPPPPPSSISKQQKKHSQPTNNDTQEEMKEWHARKQKREEENKRKYNNGGDEENDNNIQTTTITKRRKIEPNEGHYTIDNETYMEGQIFCGILEVDMPIQLWTGSSMASSEEKKLPEKSMYWKNGLILSVPKNKTTTNTKLPPTVVNITYLSSPNDEEETIEKHVPVDRIRIVLGADSNIPSTIEEARLLAMGGEVEIITNEDKTQVEVDEATGLSGWSTVSVKKTTVRQQDREEKERAAEKLRLARLEREAEQKKAEARKMEEAKVSNADDSALGAYDVWGKGDYKGVDISKDVKLSVEETAKKLSSGSDAKVSFRKAKKKKGPAAASSRRRTSADDDD